MAFEFKLPDIGEGIHEGEIVEWLVAEGDVVEEDQDIVEVMTDKATVQISSPRAGTIAKIHFQDGETVDVGQVIVTIDESGDGSTSASADAEADKAAAGSNGEGAAAPPEASEAPAEEAEEKEEKTLFDLPGEMGASRAKRPARAKRSSAGQSSGSALAMPMVRQRAKQEGIDLAQVPATGSKGHVTMADLDQFLKEPGAAAAATPGVARTTGAGHDFTIPSVPREGAAEVEPLKGLRKRIAENMVKAKTLQPHFTYVLEVRAEKLVEVREEAKELAAERGVKLTYLPFLVKAVCRAMQDHPRCNALVDEEAEELVVMEPVNMGIAKATPDGLVVPVVHDAHEKSILEIARDIAELSDKADDKKLSLDDIQGGTFTITSLGRIGGLLATPILAHPQVAIMGVHELRDVPVVEDGEVVPGKVMNLSFSFDHRVVDGYNGALFANDVKKYLEDPNLLLLESR